MAVKDNIIVITGGASGIGLALVKHFVPGNTVISIDRNAAKIAQLTAEVPTAVSLKADVCNQAETSDAIRQIENRFGRIDMLINNAGIGRFYNFAATGENELAEIAESEIATNFLAPILLTKKCLPLLARSAGPRIIYITTGLVYMPDAASPTYCSSKAGLHLFAVSLRHQLRDTRFKVIEVLPAAVDTAFSKGVDVPKISLEKFVSQFTRQLEKGRTTIRLGAVNVLYIISRLAPKIAFGIINGKKQRS